MQNLLDTTRGVRAGLSSTAYDLQSIADAFHATGNSAMSDRLSKIARNILADADAMNEAVQNNLDEYMAQTFENSNNILRAAMAGIEVGARA